MYFIVVMTYFLWYIRFTMNKRFLCKIESLLFLIGGYFTQRYLSTNELYHNDNAFEGIQANVDVLQFLLLPFVILSYR